MKEAIRDSSRKKRRGRGRRRGLALPAC